MLHLNLPLALFPRSTSYPRHFQRSLTPTPILRHFASLPNSCRPNIVIVRFVKRAAPTVVAPPAQPTDISRFTPIVIQRVSTLWTFTTRLLDGRLRGNFSIVTWMKPRWRSFNRFYFFTHNKSQFLIFLCVLALLQEIVSVGCSVGLSIRLSVRPPRLC